VPARQAPSLDFLASGLGAQLQNLDVALVGWLAGSRAAGLLAAPSRLATPLGLLASSSASVLLVQARHLRTASDRASPKRVTGAVFVLTVLGVSPLLIVPDATARLLFGAEYDDAASVFRLVAVGVCIASVNQPLAATLQARYRHRIVGASVMTGGIIDLAIVAATAHSWGAVSGGIGIVASQVTILALLARGLSSARGRGRKEDAVALVPPH
jgi:O-antigen/teichoic acid export membrane protein